MISTKSAPTTAKPASPVRKRSSSPAAPSAMMPKLLTYDEYRNEGEIGDLTKSDVGSVLICQART